MTLFIDQGVVLDIPLEEVAELCRKWGIKRLEIFGSVLREDFAQDSDIDLLYTAGDNVHWGFDFVTLCEEFESLFGRPVDMVSRQALEQSPNPIRRRAILSSVVTIYERTD
jgi:uncharacterized protein